MNKRLLFLVTLALTLLASSDALSASATDSQLKLSKFAPATADTGDKRSLRGLESTEATTNEERGPVELAAKLKASSLKKWVTESKLVQKVMTASQKRRMAKVTRLVEAGWPKWILYAGYKVTPNEYFLAKGLNPNLKFIAGSPAAWTKNEGLEQWYKYAQYFEALQK